MGNEWKLQKSEVSKIKDCPCGNGTYVSVRREYIDDYLREHTTYENEITCHECAGKYEYYYGYWITTIDYNTIKEMEKALNDFKDETYRKLFREHYAQILKRFKTKKGLYDFLYKNRLFNVPGTVQTFYKNGIEHYIGDGSFYCDLDSIEKMVDLTVGLSNENNQLLNCVKIKQKAIKDFVIAHSV